MLFAQQQTLQIFYLHNKLGHNSQLYSKSLYFAVSVNIRFKTKKCNSHPAIKSLNQHPKSACLCSWNLLVNAELGKQALVKKHRANTKN